MDSHQSFQSVQMSFSPSLCISPSPSPLIHWHPLCLSHFINGHILLPQASLNEIHKQRLEPHTVMTRWTSPGIAGKPQEGLNDLYCRRDSLLTHKLKSCWGATVKLTGNIQENKCDSHLLLSSSVSTADKFISQLRKKEVVINHDPLWDSNHRLSGLAVAQTIVVPHNKASGTKICQRTNKEQILCTEVNRNLKILHLFCQAYVYNFKGSQKQILNTVRNVKTDLQNCSS